MRKIILPVYFFVLLILSIILHYLFPIKIILSFPYNYLGIILIILGIIINVWTSNLFKENKTTIKPDQKPSILITSGPFRISRNPIYLGMLAILSGVTVILGSLITIIPPLIFLVIINFLVIPREERKMKNIFAEEYLKYKQKVRRWI